MKKINLDALISIHDAVVDWDKPFDDVIITEKEYLKLKLLLDRIKSQELLEKLS